MIISCFFSSDFFFWLFRQENSRNFLINLGEIVLLPCQICIKTSLSIFSLHLFPVGDVINMNQYNLRKISLTVLFFSVLKVGTDYLIICDRIFGVRSKKNTQTIQTVKCSSPSSKLILCQPTIRISPIKLFRQKNQGLKNFCWYYCLLGKNRVNILINFNNFRVWRKKCRKDWIVALCSLALNGKSAV